MPRLALKPDSSFFRKIALGAVGSRRVAQDLDRLGHQIAELERGAMDTKLWKEVKRKRVRIPDLVCGHCGLRIESRAKTKTELSMSHSPTDQERAWDFGMVDADVIAFPVCKAGEEKAVERRPAQRANLLLARTQLDPVASRGQGELRARRAVPGRASGQRGDQGRNRGIGNQRCLEGAFLQPRRRSRSP